MDSNNAPVRVKSGGTKVSRRTVARGAAWSVPIAAVAVSAPAMAASCVPQISLDLGRSCKCPGQSSPGEEFVYYLAFCVTNDCVVGSGAGGTFKVLEVAKDNGSVFPNRPNACFPATIGAGSTPTPVNECTTATYRFDSTNSGNFVLITFQVTVGGATTTYTQQLPSPPFCDCKNGGCTDGRCGTTNAAGVVCNPPTP
jgi:hypothetical protein